MPVDISVSISLLPLVQDLNSTRPFAFGRQKRIWLNFRKYTSPMSMLTVMDKNVPHAAPKVPISSTATKI